ncbi:MAG: methylmalonyl-CoA mutase family protein [Caulobacteraceae bacterium]|nr:methylmalonyl-CoA mutase family protein [Caulobacteraceae bacterium]
MSERPTPLAGDFAAPTRADWMKLVDKTIKGAPFETLVGHTDDGLPIQPLYRADDAAAPARPALAARDEARAWDLRTLIAHPDPARANAEALEDLEGGASSLVVRIDPTGETGVAVGSAEGLARVLDGVVLELASVAIDAGFLGPKAADWLAAAAKSSPSARLDFHLDPLGALAQAGASPGPIEAHLISAANTAARLAEPYPRASLFLASGRVAHEAGAGEALELGFAAASAVAYAKALVRAGLSMDEAFARIGLGLAVDGDYFVSIAKLRAARAIWSRIAGACGASAPARIEARASHRMIARRDPWTNMLRLTAAGFAAAAGGADAIVLGCFTDALGLPTGFARRQSRNTQLVLMEEASLGRVCDPAGGAWYLESLTDELARAGWAAFQAIEAEGGAAAALASGHVAREAGQVRARRQAAIAEGRIKLVGVTVYPNANEAEVQVETPDRRAFAVEAPSPRLPGPDASAPPLTPIRLAEPFEEASR